MFKHLLIATDGSERSQRAMDTAVALAQPLGAQLTALIVEPPLPTPASAGSVGAMVRRLEQHDRETTEHAQRVLQAAMAQAERHGVRCAGLTLRSGAVVGAIIEAAQARGCDLIVMATHVHGSVGEWLAPSHAKGVMARAALPLLVVH